MIAKVAFERMTVAQKAYKDTISKESESLHLYRNIEADLQQVEVEAGRRKYVETVLPIEGIKLIGLSIKPDEVTRISKCLK